MLLALLLLTCLCVDVYAFGHLRTGNQSGNGVTDETKGGRDGTNSVSTNAIANQETHKHINNHFSPLYTRSQPVGGRTLQGEHYQSYQYCPPGEIVLDV